MDTDIHITVDKLVGEVATAAKLWVDWFKWSGDPWITDDYGRTECFFCAEDSPNHSKDCVFVKAQKVVEEVEKMKQ